MSSSLNSTAGVLESLGGIFPNVPTICWSQGSQGFGVKIWRWKSVAVAPKKHTSFFFDCFFEKGQKVKRCEDAKKWKGEKSKQYLLSYIKTITTIMIIKKSVSPKWGLLRQFLKLHLNLSSAHGLKVHHRTHPTFHPQQTDLSCCKISSNFRT